MVHRLRSPTRIILALLLAGLAALAIVALFGGRSGVRADTSGPNASGYVWIDSNAPDPVVTFDWIDATGGTLSEVTDGDDDDGSETADLPFTFNFFGTDYTQVDISSNGFLSFNIGSDCNDNYNWEGDPEVGNPIPHDDAICNDVDDGWGGNPLIAAWFDDLDPGVCGDVYYETVGTAPDQQFVVEFRGVCHEDCDDCDAGEGITFEVILFEGSNDIKVQYMDTVFTDNPGADPDLVEEDNGQSATTGIDKDGTVGLGYSWTDPLTDNLAVLYTTNFGVPTEITLDPPTATNEIRSDHTVTATVIDGAGLPIEQAGVEFNVTDGPNAGDNNGQETALDTNGQATFTYTGDGGTGTDTIEACVVDFPKLCTTATKTWTEAPPPSPAPAPTAVAEVVQVPTALPDTGGEPGSSSSLAWLILAIGGIAALAGGVVLTRRFDRARR